MCDLSQNFGQNTWLTKKYKERDISIKSHIHLCLALILLRHLAVHKIYTKYEKHIFIFQIRLKGGTAGTLGLGRLLIMQNTRYKWEQRVVCTL